jgi:hypothetical protein
MFFSCAVASLTGCNSPEKNDVLWKNIKIGELAPYPGGEQTGSQSIKTIDFGIYIFEVPAENISDINDIWKILYTGPLQFNNSEAFSANLFLAGFGQVPMWNKIADMLHTAGGRKIETVSLLIPDGQTSDLTVARLDNEQTVFYVPSSGSMEGVAIGPGKLAFQIKAEKIPGLRDVCNVDVQPVFLSPIKSPIPQSASPGKSGEFPFTSAGFKSKMSPGDFIFLGPEKYISQQITLGGLFFSIAKPIPVVRTYLIVCTTIKY